MAARANNWTEEEIRALFRCWQENEILSIFDGKAKNTEAYDTLASPLAQDGFSCTSAPINTKVKHLWQLYFHNVIDSFQGNLW